MNTNDIYYANQVRISGSINKAAKAAYITPQALSKIIKRIENELGIELFIRSKDGMKVTENGKMFFHKSKKIIDELNELESMFDKSEHDSIKIASALGIIAVLSPDNIFSFKNKHPNVEINIIEENDMRVEKMVMDESTDIGFAVGDIDEKYFEIIKKRQIPHTIVVSKTHPLAQKSIISIKDLENEKIALESREFKVYGKFKKLCEDEGFEPNIYFETTEISLAHELAQKGKCVSVSVSTEAEHIKNVKILPIQEEFNWEWCMIKKRGKLLNNLETQFINSISFNSKF